MKKADSNGTLVKADIVDLVYGKVGFTRQEAAESVDILFEEIKSRLAQGENVRISRFASFILKKKKCTQCAQPQDGGVDKDQSSYCFDIQTQQTITSFYKPGYP